MLFLAFVGAIPPLTSQDVKDTALLEVFVSLFGLYFLQGAVFWVLSGVWWLFSSPTPEASPAWLPAHG